MFRKFGQMLMIVAALSVTGAHWFAFQSVAWTTMLADNLQRSSLAGAIEQTFDGKHPCCLCKEIAKDKQTERKSDLQVALKKLDFSHDRFEFVFAAPAHFYEMRATSDAMITLTLAPALPPPKELLG